MEAKIPIIPIFTYSNGRAKFSNVDTRSRHYKIVIRKAFFVYMTGGTNPKEKSFRAVTIYFRNTIFLISISIEVGIEFAMNRSRGYTATVSRYYGNAHVNLE